MKKEYIKPYFKVQEINIEDILLSSINIEDESDWSGDPFGFMNI